MHTNGRHMERGHVPKNCASRRKRKRTHRTHAHHSDRHARRHDARRTCREDAGMKQPKTVATKQHARIAQEGKHTRKGSPAEHETRKHGPERRRHKGTCRNNANNIKRVRGRREKRQEPAGSRGVKRGENRREKKNARRTENTQKAKGREQEQAAASKRTQRRPMHQKAHTRSGKKRRHRKGSRPATSAEQRRRGKRAKIEGSGSNVAARRA
ncbi:hypothetical protein, conserved in T. vivax [Trypanosoma vivax Y486]|uniref:Uncharacterized protein n=1 Tax=Trypanosoma vivax (strain Y486) TaxID=1055687 RepID=F9WPD8_TRYVY|nr:hypothetical protein, conserved in T. vivax [Trypanosoma vivax Y486]|eukprot:CCD19415.1 hypothetical protein, conserved in T. vivax [Trypanosoma vivax Y486]